MVAHIVKDFFIDNTRIKIADDCCRDKTTEDVEKILYRIEQIVQTYFDVVVEVEKNI